MIQKERDWSIQTISDNTEMNILFLKTLEILQSLGPEFSENLEKIRGLQERFLNERFHLAVLGQFKRGKSTFINALIGEELLPTAVLPLTAVPIFLLWGPEARVRVFLQEGLQNEELKGQDKEEISAFLAQFVTEAGNPKNYKKVSQVEVFYPSLLLQKGVVLIDTPGIGSTFRHNTETTLNFLPQCDAALFLVSADPPITEVEVEFLKAVRTKVAHLFFILNKVDYLKKEEIAALVTFIKNVLREQVGIEGEPPLFCVSARLGLEARKRNDPELWEQSGLDEVWHYLIDFLAREKKNVLQTALAKKATDVIADVLMRLQLTLRSLEMPLAELDERLNIFEQKIQEANQQRIFLGDLLVGDRKRMLEFLEQQAESLRQKARAYLLEIVRSNLEQMGDNVNETEIQKALAKAIPEFFEKELGEMARIFEQRVTEVLRPYQQKVEELIETVRKTAAELFDIPYHAPSSAEAFEMKRQPYWVTQKLEATFNIFSENTIIKFLPPAMRRAKIAQRLQKQVNDLVLTNVENLRWATLQNLDQAFRQFGLRLEERLQETILATRGAIQAAREKRLEHSQNIAQEIIRVQTFVDQLKEIKEKFQAMS
ncbi:dynamin family protein [Carboxydothermus ferrireducens]|uniref:GTP-binding protein EngB required for normal cell division n=1 Tax=Carboxydothermus ferrireducens DSM 11255 TaxID=1119529 RepID=A0ABX2RC97_9THEO|nr:dynamin family protein [Carboxydothermus ferrireducens]NYE58818.1 GTP-binding protein EngB required for normal cell division [Carboxydothermus ferrireducens DSM 11255]